MEKAHVGIVTLVGNSEQTAKLAKDASALAKTPEGKEIAEDAAQVAEENEWMAGLLDQTTVDAHLQDHVKASRAVEERRKQEVGTVLGRVPTFAECVAAEKKFKAENKAKKTK